MRYDAIGLKPSKYLYLETLINKSFASQKHSLKKVFVPLQYRNRLRCLQKAKSHKAGKVKSKKRNLNIKTNKKVGRE